MDKFNEKIKDCMENQPPYCSVSCPFEWDIRDFVAKIKRGNFKAAFRAYRNAVGFPYIVSDLCEKPCEDACILKDMGGAVNLRELESASIKYTKNTSPQNYNVPKKNKSIGIIGANLCGLACALRLGERNYDIHIYDTADSIGADVINMANGEMYLSDINKHLEKININYSLSINPLTIDYNIHDVYLITDRGRAFAESVAEKDNIFFENTKEENILVESIAEGFFSANNIEVFIKTGARGYKSGDKKADYTMDISEELDKKITPGENGYTQSETIAEANRCLECRCKHCMENCDIMKAFYKTPSLVAEEVRVTTGLEGLKGDINLATKMIASCSQCKACSSLCPIKLNIDELLLKSRYKLKDKDKFPWAYHDFYLRDMKFANSKNASIVSKIDKNKESKYAFFPGCQLGASNPDYVTKTFRWLSETHDNMAIMLECCGAPAIWSGIEDEKNNAINKIKNDWESLGKPELIFTCPTCKQTFEKYLPDIPGVFFYEVYIDKHDGEFNTRQDRKNLAIFDPCSSRDYDRLKSEIRTIIKSFGYSYDNEDGVNKNGQCCSFGGHMSIANPELAEKMISERVSKSKNSYLTYCSNCRDIFSKSGKKALHILDIIFDIDDENRLAPLLDQRNNNRVQAKKDLIDSFFTDEEPVPVQENSIINLIISDELNEKISNLYILKENISEVINYCEKTNDKLIDDENMHSYGCKQIGYVTYWAEYEKSGDSYILHNAYSHRIKVENG